MLYLPNAKRCIGGFSSEPASNIAHNQLKNPAASGVTVYVRRALVTTGNRALLQRHDSDLATLQTSVGNKDMGGPAPVAQLRTATLGSLALGTELATLRTTAQATVAEFDWSDSPIVLAEGQGILFATAGSGANLSVVWEWDEVAA